MGNGEGGRLEIFLILNGVIVMVLIEDGLTLSLMVQEYWYRNPSNRNTTTLANVVITKQQSGTVLGVAAECGPGITTMPEA